MNVLGRPRLRSARARIRRIDKVFERTLYTVLVAMFSFTIVGMLTQRASVQFKQITITGAEATGEERVRTLANDVLSQKLLRKIERNNAVFYPRHTLETSLYELDAHIAHVELSADPLSELHIDILEYQPALLWCGEEKSSSTSTEQCYLGDEEGYVYSTAPAYSGYPFIVFRSSIAGQEEGATAVGLYVLSLEDFARVREFRSALQGRGIIVREVAQQGEGDYRFRIDDGSDILWAVTRDPLSSAENFSAGLLEMSTEKNATTSPRVIDLRFENKIFYK